MERTCVCGKVFRTYPCKLKVGWGVFCSRKCAYENFPKTPPEERFWKHVNKTDSCWEWTASKYPFGYGQFNHTHGVKPIAAHRFSWEQHYGPIPDGLLVLHKCDNPSCVNPNHLFLGTHQDNVADKISKGRGMKGETQHIAKLKGVDIPVIRKMYYDGISQTHIAKKYGVSTSTIQDVTHHRTWNHIQ